MMPPKDDALSIARRIAADIWAKDEPFRDEVESNPGLRLVMGIEEKDPMTMPEQPSTMTRAERAVYYQLSTTMYAIRRGDIRTWQQFDAVQDDYTLLRFRGLGPYRVRLIRAWRRWLLGDRS